MKKGFTLIELLAVIVVLAIIALITTPIIINIISQAQEGANLRSVEGYAKALETAYYTSKIDGEATVLNTLTAEYNGATVECITKTIVNNKITLSNCTVDGMGTFEYTNGKASKTVKTTTPTLSLEVCDYTLCSKGTVYYNPETSTFCSKRDYEANTNASNTGNTTGCMKWYTYKDNGNGTYQLILDHNTTAKVRWSSTTSNTTNGDIVKAQLETDISSWDNSIKINARLITVDEVAEITGNTSFNGATSIASDFFYFDSLTTSASLKCRSGDTSGCKYGWLYDRTKTNCTTYGCLNNADIAMTGLGYWTSTPVFGNTSYSWFVNSFGYFNVNVVNDSDFSGVRPVITI